MSSSNRSSVHRESYIVDGGLYPGLASTPYPKGYAMQYQSTISGHNIIESTAPDIDTIQITYDTHASITTEARLRETAIDTITTALDSSSGISFISDFEAHCNFAPAERKQAATPMVISTAGGYIFLPQYVVADIFFPCLLNGQEAIAKTTAVLFVRNDRIENGAGILLGTDFMEAQSFSIQYSAKCAVIGSCGDASIPLSFFKNKC